MVLTIVGSVCGVRVGIGALAGVRVPVGVDVLDGEVAANVGVVVDEAVIAELALTMRVAVVVREAVLVAERVCYASSEDADRREMGSAPINSPAGSGPRARGRWRQPPGDPCRVAH